MPDPCFLEHLPHRPPFLWLDRVIEISTDTILAEKVVAEDLEVFRGHYPDYPIMPGVLLCEAVFQAGALLIGQSMDNGADVGQGVPVLTRILGAKFKREVRPGDILAISARLVERMGPAWIMKGAVRVGGKLALQVEFSCARKEA